MHWQARYLTAAVAAGEEIPKGARKYYHAPGSKPKRLLYNKWRAKSHSSMVIICEGVFDAIRAGVNCGVATFGKSVSVDQKALLWENWGSQGAIGVVALDPDAKDEIVDLVSWMSGWSKVVQMNLPKGIDIGDLSQTEVVDRIRDLLK